MSSNGMDTWLMGSDPNLDLDIFDFDANFNNERQSALQLHHDAFPVEPRSPPILPAEFDIGFISNIQAHSAPKYQDGTFTDGSLPPPIPNSSQWPYQGMPQIQSGPSLYKSVPQCRDNASTLGYPAPPQPVLPTLDISQPMCVQGIPQSLPQTQPQTLPQTKIDSSDPLTFEKQNDWLQKSQGAILSPDIGAKVEFCNVPGIRKEMFMKWTEPNVVLTPMDAWILRSLTPEQRVRTFFELRAYGLELILHLEGSRAYDQAWNNILALSGTHVARERQWFNDRFLAEETRTVEDLAPACVREKKRVSHEIWEAQTHSTKIARWKIAAIWTGASQAGPPVQGLVYRPPTPQQHQLTVRQPPITSAAGGSINNPISFDDKITPHSGMNRDNRLAPPSDITSSRALFRTRKRAVEVPEDAEGQNSVKQARGEGSGTRASSSLGKPTQLRRHRAIVSAPQKSTALLTLSNIPRTTGRDSPVEIREWRQQNAGKRPNERRHPLDQVAVPYYPSEDSLQKSKKLPNGNFSCKHDAKWGKKKCCTEGIERKPKGQLISKQKRTFMDVVENSVVAGRLHVAHKDWPGWHKDIKDERRKAQVDALLQHV